MSEVVLQFCEMTNKNRKTDFQVFTRSEFSRTSCSSERGERDHVLDLLTVTALLSYIEDSIPSTDFMQPAHDAMNQPFSLQP